MIVFRNFKTENIKQIENNKISEYEAIEVKGSEIQKNEIFESLSGINDFYSGEILINGYSLRKNLDLFQEHTVSLLFDNTFFPNISMKKQFSMLSKRWSGTNLSGASFKVFGLEDYQHQTPKQINNQNILRKFELAKLICCPAMIWMIKNIDNLLEENDLDLMHDLVQNRISKGGIVIYTSTSPFLNDITMNTINLNT